MQTPDDVQGIQSIELGGSVLRALINANGDTLPLRDVAQVAGMSASKARRYLLSFARIGLVSQEAATGYYGLGPLAIRLGLAAIAAIAVDRLAPPVIRELRRRLQETVVLTIWSDNGPIILQAEDSQLAVMINARIGSTLPMLGSATGRLFAAFFDPDATRPRITEELSRVAKGPALRQAQHDFDLRLDEVRRHGAARTEGELLNGVSAMAAPVFDHTGSLIAGLGVLGHRGILDVSWTGTPCTELKRSAAALSELCGYTPPK
ncbi:MAG TPA: IclR family transcriptional regulator [Candidatus Lustribacter sp.]|jgi:DNA-binding IclR family transcriptional regulator|nr:IclR family transcriptional regulator [Candidatus Lustribacter sp.]